MIYIIGLGAGNEKQIPYGVVQLLNEKKPLYLRTKEHPMVSYLDTNNIPYTSFDYVYEKYDTFQEVYAEIINTIKTKGKEEDIVYAVPGHPCVAEYTVKVLCEETNAEIMGGQSFLDAMFAALKIDPIDGLLIMDALDFKVSKLIPSINLLIPQVFDQLTASDLKLDLMEHYPDEHIICIAKAVGSEQESLTWLPLYELDHDFTLDNLTTIFVPKIENT